MKNITLFLKELNVIRADYRCRAKRKEQFNIFSVLCNRYEEVHDFRLLNEKLEEVGRSIVPDSFLAEIV